MGAEYYIINRKNKTAYDLGKGGWWALSKEISALSDLEYLAQFIIDDVYDLNADYYTDKQHINFKEYIRDKIAPDLFEFAKDTHHKDLIVFSDSGDDVTICRSLGYRFVGHRYHEKDSSGYAERLDFLNRHFDEDRPKHQYNPDDYKEYPEYKIYSTSYEEEK